MPDQLKTCLCDPISKIFDAARYLDAAVSAHMAGNLAFADKLIRIADMPAITQWTESLWGKDGPFCRRRLVDNPLPFLAKAQRAIPRMPSRASMAELLARDGFHCRFCGIPVVRQE